MSPIRLHLAYKNIKRLRDIVSVLIKHGFYPLLEKLHLTPLVSVSQRLAGKKAMKEKEALSPPVRLRLAFEELGPTFIKLGQILSTRPDIGPEEYITELLKLQDEVSQFPFEEVVKVIEREFKRPWREVFREVEKTPVAAASIAQVHRAVTRDGTEVMLKVQRPGIEEIIETDTSILRYLARLMIRYLPETRAHDPMGTVDEFSRTIKKEMDFTLEASYMERFRVNFAGDRRVRIPKVYWDYTRKRILTMERMKGIKIDDVERLRENAIDTEKVAHLIVEVFFTQVFDHSLFHGDLHPGNILVADEDTLVFLDFGIVGRLDEELKRHLADIFLGVLREDFEGLTRLYLQMGILPEDIDEAAFAREYWDVMVRYVHGPASRVSIGDLLMGHIRLITRYAVKIPKDLLLFSKCILELEGLVRTLDPEANIIEECRPYAAKAVRERMRPSTIVSEGLSTVSDYSNFVNTLPGYARRIMKKVMTDNLSVDFVHRGLEDLLGEIDRSSNRLTFGIIMAAMVIGSSLILATGAGPTVNGYPVLGIIGFVLAGLLGLWLSFQILRSGKY